jgi:hypothetical protein
LYNFPNTTSGNEQKELYEKSLYSNFRFNDANIQISLYSQGSQPNTHRIRTANLDCRDIVGSNFVYEASATPNNTFGLGAANVDTLTCDILYSSSRSAILDDIDSEVSSGGGTESNAEFYVELGYGHESPYPDEDTYMSGKTALVPLGTFIMQDKSCKVGENKYTLKLQSLMSRFDRDLPAVFDTSNSAQMTDILERRGISEPDPLAILEWCCKFTPRTGYWDSNEEYHTAVRMKLSSKMDTETSEGYDYTRYIPNLTDYSFRITNETGYLTYRDIIKDIATICCCFATTDEFGDLLLVPFAPTIYDDVLYEQGIRLNDGSAYTVSTEPTTDICSKYTENMGIFKIKQVKCIASVEDETTHELVEVDYSKPTEFKGDPNYYDITGTKLLKGIIDTDNLPLVVENIANVLAYTYQSQANYRPIPFDIETASGDFRLRLGDWVSCISNFADRLGKKFSCKAQIMRMTLRLNGKARYQSFVLPSDNDRNASKRQSEAQGDYPNTEGGVTPPPPPEPPVVIMDDMGQWLFGDEEVIREEYEAVGEPGRTYYVSQVGQWSFNNTAL